MYTIETFRYDSLDSHHHITVEDKQKFNEIDWEDQHLFLIFNSQKKLCIVLPDHGPISKTIAYRIIDELNSIHQDPDETTYQTYPISHNILESGRSLYAYLSKRLVKHHFSVYIDHNILVVDIMGKLATSYINIIPSIWEGFLVKKNKLEF